MPSRKRRLCVVWNDDLHSEAQSALTLLSVLAIRVGAVPVGAPVPAAIRQHRWSPLVCHGCGVLQGSTHHASVGDVGKHGVSCFRAHSVPRE